MSGVGLQHYQNGVYVASTGAFGVPVVELERLGRPEMLVDVGLIRVDDAQGRIEGHAPGTQGFVQALLQQGRWQKLVASYEGVGAFHDELVLEPNAYYIFGIVQGGDFEAVRDNREYGRLWWSTGRQSAIWQEDGKDYLGWRVYSFQDPDVVLQLRQSRQSMGTVLPGLGQSQYWKAVQSYKLEFGIESVGGGSRVGEFGLFTVDDERGRIGNLLPGQRGYAQAALNRRIEVVSNGQLVNGGVVQLEAGKIYSSYQVSGGTATDWFRVNPTNSIRGSVIAYFDRPLDNPDKQEHISWRNGQVYLAGGLNRDMRDMRLWWRLVSSLRLSNGSTNENVPVGTVIGELSAEGGRDRFSLVSGYGDNAQFVIEGNQLKWGIVPDFETKNSYSIRVRAVGADGVGEEKDFQIRVLDVNEAPFNLALSNNGTAENVPVGTVIGSFSSQDPDRGDVHTYSLVDGFGDNASFSIEGNQLKWAISPDFETKNSYTIKVRTTDRGGLSTEREFTIAVTNVNEAPFNLQLSKNSSVENVAIGTVIGQFTSQDPDAGDSHTYSLVSGEGDADNTAFEIVGKELRWRISPNFEQKNTYSIRIRATDREGLTAEKIFTIRVTDANDPPTGIVLGGGLQVAENSAYGVVVGEIVRSIDEDLGQSHTYELVNDAGGRFALSYADGKTQIIMNNGSLLDYEQATQHTIRIRTTDSGNPQRSYEQDVVIQVLNVNEAPVFTSTPVGSAVAGLEYRYDIRTADSEADVRRIEVVGDLPAWLNFVDNGDGTGSLVGTPSGTDGGIYTFQLRVVETNTPEPLSSIQNVVIAVDAVLRERRDFSPEYYTNLVIPNERSVLQFRVKDLYFDRTDTSGIRDAFEVALLGADGRSLVFTYAEGKDSFINFTEGLEVVRAPGVTYDATTGIVSLNLLGVPAETVGKLVFRLVNNDRDEASYVEVSDIRFVNAAEDASAPVRGFSLEAEQSVASPSRVEFGRLANITGSVRANYQRTSFTERGKVLHAQFQLENIGTYGVNGPVVVAVKNISDASVSLRNADGVTPDGFAYIDVTKYLVNGRLDPNGRTAIAELVFNNPNEVQFSYELVVLGSINHAPEITSNPLLPGRDVAEVVAGRVYTYDVEAKDLDNDTLTYRLLVAPEGLSIDSETGLIRWTTQEANIGNHSIVVEVRDGRGGVDIQSYTLSVIAQPPNRPPVFTTDPVVDAYINQLYQYDSNAIDPDQDEVTYSLIIGPNGMTVNRTTGMVEWTPPAALVIGDTVLGRIRVPGENDEFTFSGVAGQRIYFDFLTYSGGDTNWNFRVITPSGRQIHNSHMRWWDWGLHTLDETGNYRIVVDPVGEQTGNYGFRLIDPSLVPLVEYDTIITDKLLPGNQDRLYRFTAAKGQRLFLDALHRSSPNVDWYVIDSKNTVIHYSDFGDIEMVMPQDGEYILVARGRAGFGNSVDYTFSLVNSDVITRQVPIGEVIEGAIAKKGGQHTLEFNVRAGQQVFFDSLDGNADLRYTIIDPFGDVVRTDRNAATYHQGIDIRYDRAFLDGFTFAYDGKYKILVDGYGETVGKYKFRLIDKASAESYTVNELLEGTVDFNATGAKLFKFTVQPNTAPNNVDPNQRQYVYFDGLSTGSVGNWLVYNSNGLLINNAPLTTDREMWLSAGDYYLVMQGTGSSPNYRFRVITSDTPTADITSQIYTTASNGQVIEGNIAKKGSFDTYTFTGRAGQQLFFDALSGSNYFTYDLISPNGTVLIDDADIRSDRFFLDGFSLPTDGVYKLVVASDFREETGAYKFRLLDMGSAMPYTLDTVIGGTLGNGGFATDFYSFELTNDTYLYFDFTAQAGQSGSWHLFNDSGVQVTSGDNLATDRELSVKAGKYILAVRGNGTTGANNYQFSVITPEFTTQGLSFDTVVSGAISEKGEWDTYTFTVNAGEQLWFDSLDGNTAGITYTLYAPQGRVLVNGADIGSDRRIQDGLIAPVSGTYKLVIDGTGETTGNYKFQLLSKGSATSLVLNTDEVGTFTNNGTSAKLYKFTLTDKQYVYIDANPTNQTNQSGNWILYAPNGNQISWGNLTQDHERWLEAGTYTLAVQGAGANSTSYGIRIITPQLTTTALTFGQEYVGAIGEKGEWDSYTFSGTAGQGLKLEVTDPGNPNALRIIIRDEYGKEVVNRFVSQGDSQPFYLSYTGNYTLVVDGEGEGRSGYGFRLITAPAQTPVNHTGTPINFNQVYSDGAYYRPLTYTFYGRAGQNLFYDAQVDGWYNPISVVLYDPYGQEIYSGPAASDQIFTLAVDGQYQLVAHNQYNWNHYVYNTFQLIDLDTVPVTPVGSSVTFTLSPYAARAYRWNITDANWYYRDSEGGDGTAFIYRKNGQLLTHAPMADKQRLWLDSGEYYVVYAARGYGSSHTSTLRVAGAVEDKGVINFYDQRNDTGTVSGRINTPFGQHIYRFTGQAGQLLMVDGLASNGGLVYRVYDPNGRLLRDARGNGSYHSHPEGVPVQSDTLPNEGLLLTMDGIYTIQVVHDAYRSYYSYPAILPEVGDYELRLFDVSNAETANLDSTISGTLTKKGSHVYRFTNPMRQYIYVDGQAGNGNWYIYAKDGSLVSSHQLFYDRQFWLDEGEYYLVVQGFSDNPSNYALRIETPSLISFPTITYGQTVSGIIDELGEQHYYSFQGRAGDKVYFDSLGSSNAHVTLWFGDKNGRLIVSDWYANYWTGWSIGLYSDRDYQPSDTPYQSPTRGLTLLEDGIYYITVDGLFDGSNNDQRGSYNFRLLNLNNAPVVNLDDLIRGTFSNGGLSAHTYRFNLTQRHIFVDGQSGHGNWIIYRADGTKVGEGPAAHNGQFWLDPGEYYLVVSGQAGGSDYQLQLVNTESRAITPAISFDTVISDALTKKGQQHYYTFEGRKGQRLLFDGLGTTGNIYARITDPLGRLVTGDGVSWESWNYIWGIQTNADRFPDQGLTLWLDGIYTITIDGYDSATSEQTGTYSFRLLDLDTKPTVSFDVDIQGTFEHSGRGATAYQFSLDRPTYLYFDAKQGDGAWAVYKRNGNLVTSGRLWEDRELWLDAGSYSLVFTGSGSDANYKLQISKPDLPTTAYTVGEVISGTISKEGDQHYYTFSGKAGQVLYLDSQSKVNGFRVRITAPSGKSLIGDFDTFNSDDKDFIILSETGEYTLTVDPVNDVVGDYRLRLIEYGDKATMPTQIVLNAANPTATVSGAFEDGNRREVDVYRFTSAGKQNLFVDATGDGNHWWGIYKPNGENLVWGRLTEDKEVYLEAEGQYTLVLWGGGSANNAYEVNLSLSQNDVRAYTVGTTVSSSLTLKGESDTYTFTGSAGQLLFFDALTGNSNITAKLYDEAGTLVADRHTGTDWQVQLASSGTYRLVIDGVGATTGNYSFVVRDGASAPAIQVGVPVEGSLSVGNGQAVYRIAGRAGQVLRFDLDALTWQGANWVLYDPSGVAIAQPNATRPDFQVALAGDGNYSLVISGSSSTEVPYRFTVTDVTPARVNPSGLGVVRSGTFNTANQVDEYTFTANAGTVIWFDSMTGTNDWRERVEILNPDGTRLMEGELRYDHGSYVLQQTGTYRVRVRDWYGQATMRNYSFQVLELPKDPDIQGINYINSGEIVSGTSTLGQATVYTLEASAGSKLMFNGMVGANVSFWLYDAYGNLVSSRSNFGTQDTGLTVIDTTGVYNLVVGGASGTNTAYKFQLLSNANAPKITRNVSVSSLKSDGRESDIYYIDAVKGETLFFDNISFTSSQRGEYRWQLYSPSGVRVSDNALDSDFQVSITDTGRYVVYVSGGNSSEPYGYTFRVYSQQAKSVSELDVLVPGAGGQASGNNDQSLGKFRVTLQAKDEHGATVLQSYTIRVWGDPDNGNPIIVSAPPTRYSLTETGYVYQLQTLDPDGDDLFYRLVEGPKGAFINSDTGELVWVPESNVRAGDKVQFKVEVSDRRGGYDTQSFEVEVFSRLGKISGIVWEDLNANTFRDSKLISGDSPYTLFKMDFSGSMGSTTVNWSDPNLDIYNLDYSRMSPLDWEFLSYLLLVEQIKQMGRENNVYIGLSELDANGGIDMEPGTEGFQLFTLPSTDSDNNGVADYIQVLSSSALFGGASNAGGAEYLIGVAEALPDDAVLNVVYMSDGFISVEKEGIRLMRQNPKLNLVAFALPADSSLDTMKLIDPDAIQITKVEDILDYFSSISPSASKEPLMEDVIVYLDSNNNGVLDPDEPWQYSGPRKTFFTEESGRVPLYFEFGNLLPGTYNVRIVVPSGYEQTRPSSEGYTLTVTDTEFEFIKLFGLHKITPPANRSPQFVTTPQTIYKVGSNELLRYDALARDPDGDRVSYDLLLAPEGMTIDSDTGVVLWIPTAQQVNQYYQEFREARDRLIASGSSVSSEETIKFQVLVRAKDGRGGVAVQALNVKLVPDNTPPVFVSTPPADGKPQVGKVFQYQAKAQDVDRDTLTYSLVSGAPSGVTIDAQTGLVSWTPTGSQLGRQRFTIKVSDGKGGEALQTVQLEVINPVPNHAPVIVSTPRSQVRVETPYVYVIEATDADGDALTYSLVGAPAGMTIEGNVISWLPTVNQTGLQDVAVRVTDSQGGSVTQGFQVQVSHVQENNSPVITSAPRTFVANLGREYRYDLTGYDPDGDMLVWGLEKAPEGMVIDARTGALRWNAKPVQLGEHEVVVSLYDNYGAGVLQSFTLLVTGQNAAPRIVSTAITQGAVAREYRYQVVATDAENDVITYSLVQAPEGMVIDAQTGVITWTPRFTGTYEIQVQAKDSEGAASVQTYQIVVGTAPMNQAPRITSTPVFVADTAQTYQYQVTAEDPDAGDSLTYALVSAPTGMRIDSQTGLVTWENPTVGTHRVVVGVRDAGGLGVAQSFTLTARTNQAPVIVSTPGTSGTPGLTYAYDVIARDADGGRLSYQLDNDSLARGMTIDDMGRLRWTPNNSQIGEHGVTVTVKDDLGAEVTQRFTIRVAPDDVAPTVKLGFAGTNPAQVGQTVYYQVQATDNVRVANIELTVDGQRVALDQFGRAAVKLERAGVIQAVARVTDGAGNVSTDTFAIDVYDPNVPQNAPIVRLDLGLIPNGMITRLTELRGLVDDPDDNLSSYKVEVAPKGTQNWFTMFSVTGREVADGGVLGKFDPTVIDDGVYTLRLTARDTSGLESTVAGDVEVVSGQLKFGEFQLRFTDMLLNVGNIPVQLIRTYDTLKLNVDSPDLAPGWRVEFRDVDLRTSLGVMSADEQFIEEIGYYNRTRGLKQGDKIYLTIGGKREVFQISLVPAEREGLILPRMYDLVFDPVGTTKSKLTFTGSRSANMTFIEGSDGKIRNMAGIPLDFSSNFSMSYYNTKLVLITEEGMQYEIDPATGKIDRIGADLYNIRRRITGSDVVEANPNPTEYLELTDKYIKSSYGSRITFERDGKGRIVAAVDPDGNRVRYSYDDNGDLVSVTDREGNTTRFEYSSTRKHYLEKVIDPLNRPVMRNEYDAMGRLTKVFDANGNAINMTFDPENQIQVVTDPLGNSTTYEYDDRGNTVQVVDALGGVTRFVYSQDNKLVSATDAVGNTWQYSYDANGNLSQQILPSGLVLTYQNDAAGRQTFGMSSTGETSTYFYNAQEKSPSKYINSRGIVYEAQRVGQHGFKVIVDGKDLGTYIFDGPGDNAKPLKIVDARGIETNYTYDSKGRVTEEKVVLRDAHGSSNFVTTYVYDDQTNSVRITDPFGNVRVQTFNAQKLMVTESINGVSVTYKYDNLDRLEAAHYADGTKESVSYDALGRPITYTDRAGKVYRREFDALGRITRMILPDGSTYRWEYDAIGRVTKEVYPDGSYVEKEYQKDWTKPVSEKIFSASGQLLKHFRYEYDLNGRVSASIDINGRRTEYRYTSSGIMSQIVKPDGQVIDLSPSDLSGKPEARIRTKDERGFTWVYDSFLGQINAVIDAHGNRHEYSYNRFGKVDTFTDGEGHITQYIYDDAGQEIARILPDGSRQSLSYSGNLVTVTDYKGNVFERVVNSDGSVSQLRQPDGTIWNYEYNELGLLTKVKDRDGNVLLSYTYDTLGRIISKVQPDGRQISYEYNEQGLVTKVQNGNHVTTYTYDQDGLLIQINDSLVGTTRYEYDFVNASVAIISPSGGKEVQFFDRNGYVSSQRFYDANGQVISTFDYYRNNYGLLTQVVKDDTLPTRTVVTYAYDSRGQLAKETYIDSTTTRVISYRYDARGNRIERHDSADGVTTYTYGVNGELLSESKNGIETTYTYDRNGNLLRKANQFETTEFTWNLLNLLTSVTTRNSQGEVIHQEQYTYDPLGNRVGQRINGQDYTFLVDSVTTGYSSVRAVYDANGTIVRSYVYDGRGNSPLSQVAGGNKLFFLRDYRGSTTHVTDEQNVVQASYQYDAFGRILRRTGSSDINHLYNGEWTDKTGLQYLRARYLNPDAGSFISRDPIYDGEIENPLTRNQYLYALGDPVNYTDPSGLFSIGELNVSKMIENTLQGIKTWNSLSTMRKIAIALEKVCSAWTWFELGIDIAVDYLRSFFPIGVNENIFLNMITTGFDTGGHGGDIAYGYSKDLGPAKVEWDIRPWFSINDEAGGFSAGAFYLELSAKFSIESNSDKGQHSVPFVPGIAQYLGLAVPQTYTTSGNKYSFKYELKKAISGISYGSSLSNYDEHKYSFDAGQEVELWSTSKAAQPQAKWVWGVVGGGTAMYSPLYGGFGKSAIKVGTYAQFSVDDGPHKVAKYKFNIMGAEVGIKGAKVNTYTGVPLPGEKPKLYAVLKPFGDVVEDAEENKQFTYDLSKLFGL